MYPASAFPMSPKECALFTRLPVVSTDQDAISLMIFLSCNLSLIYGKALYALISSKGMFASTNLQIVTCRRCAVSDCKFAHGMQELRQSQAVPKVVTIQVCTMWANGRCALGAHCRHAHSFEPELMSLPSDDGVRTPLVLNEAISTQISLDETICSNSRRRLDLFPCLDFTNEIPDPEEEDSLLSCISREMLQLEILNDDRIVYADGDDSPWTLPR